MMRLRQDREVVGGGEDPRVPGDPAQRPGVLVVHLPRTMPRGGAVWYSVAAIRSSSTPVGL